MAAALALAAAAGGLELVSGLFGYFLSGEQAGIAESRGRMFRAEAEADAQRYAEQAQGFKASQKLAYLKSGVKLTGSPLDILDETARVTAENISAIRARGAAGELEYKNQASEARVQGRMALLSGFTGGLLKAGAGFYNSRATAASAKPRGSVVGYQTSGATANG